MTREEAIKIIDVGKNFAYDEKYVEAFDMAIEALKLIPDNATNGDVIKAMFPDESDFETDFDTDWWNAPYRKE